MTATQPIRQGTSLRLESVAIRAENFARAALQVEFAIGFPAEIQMAAWSLETDTGRHDRDWLEGRSFYDATLFHAKILQEASTGVEGLDAIAKFLDAYYPGLFARGQERHLLLAIDRMRKERG